MWAEPNLDASQVAGVSDEHSAGKAPDAVEASP
jgi:hypothetical protein